MHSCSENEAIVCLNDIQQWIMRRCGATNGNNVLVQGWNSLDMLVNNQNTVNIEIYFYTVPRFVSKSGKH